MLNSVEEGLGWNKGKGWDWGKAQAYAYGKVERGGGCFGYS